MTKSKKQRPFLMIMAAIVLSQSATEQIDVTVAYDADGNPLSATGQKQLVDESKNAVNDGEPNTLVISAKAIDDYNAAIATAKSNLEGQLVSDNYPDGVFTASAQS